MKQYAITGSFIGAIIVEYSAEGLLLLIDMRCAELTDTQVNYLKKNLPIQAADLAAFEKSARLTIKEQSVDITFELFYNRFDMKKGKNEAQKAWGRLSQGDQMKAYLYIPAYNRDLKLNTWKNKMYPATYLNKKIWED